MVDRRPQILIIDDDPEFAADLTAILAGEFDCRMAASGEEGLGAIAGAPPDAVVLDLMLGGRNGLEILASIRRLHPHLQVVMATDHPSPETEAAALNAGALYYVRKSAGRAEVAAKLRKCLEVGRVSRQAHPSPAEVHQHFLTSSPRMRRLDGEISRVAAAAGTTVLITGESGTGKSLIAREVHRRSSRAAGPFQRVNVASLTEELIKSELFGHRRGAFTGAIEDRRGYFEAAGGGTLFLDEIGDLPLPIQGMLNTAIEERRITPVGSTDELPVDVRIIAATSADLHAAVEAGRFRRDLYSRLSVAPLRVPPLREHPEDIADLAAYFAGRIAAEQDLPPARFDATTVDRLRLHSWPYNTRELRNAIERALIFHGRSGVLPPEAFAFLEDTTHAPAAGRVWGPYPAAGGDLLAYRAQRDAVLLAFKRDLLTRAYRAAGGSIDRPHPDEVSRVAESTGLTTKGVRDILRELAGEED